MKIGLIFVVAFVCGFAGAELLHIWREKSEQRVVQARPYTQVMQDVDLAIPQLVEGGVYWFDGSIEDAQQLKDVAKALEPSMKIAVMKVEGVREIAIINTQHAIFGNGGMLLREVEQKLFLLAPA